MDFNIEMLMKLQLLVSFMIMIVTIMHMFATYAEAIMDSIINKNYKFNVMVDVIVITVTASNLFFHLMLN